MSLELGSGEGAAGGRRYDKVEVAVLDLSERVKPGVVVSEIWGWSVA